jgi:lysine-ketoglutarate reductase/saccharopine dehydrogenase-like protein (TIGR00300 family)
VSHNCPNVSAPLPSATVAAEGHLIDSQLLTGIFDTVIERGGAFEVLAFEIGRTNDQFSRLTLKVSAPDDAALAALLEALLPFGCHAATQHDALVRDCDRDGADFTFMSNDVSSERRVEVSVARIARMMKDVRAAGRRIAFVAGPVVVHTGGAPYFARLVRGGYVNVLLAGNALAVHDAEQALFNTSLGVDLDAGAPVSGGHRHHMRAINLVNRAGGIRAAVESGVLRSGVMVECVRAGVETVLAGSIRDDGPLLDTITDIVEAQDRYTAALRDVGIVIVLSTMLHGIGVGNMLPAWVPVVCVDINPAVVTKLADRGSSQTIGLVTDVGLFLHHLAKQLDA